MKKTVIIWAAAIVVFVTAAFLTYPVLVDFGIKQQAQNIGNRFRHQLLTDGELHIVTVGTGTPNANLRRVQPSLAVIVDGVFILFDVGAGAAQQADILGLPLSDLNAVFLTHLHSDHIADLPLVASKGWRFGRTNSLHVYGPTGTREMTEGFNQAHRFDREYRYENIKLVAASLETAIPIGHDVGTPGEKEKKLVQSFDNGLEVYAFLVDHAPVKPAFGYRLEYKNRTVVISGDTKACDNMIRQSQGADLLIHEGFNKNLVNRMEKLIEDDANKSLLALRHLATQAQKYHTSPVEAARIAEAASVKKLIFTHIDPPLGPFLIRWLVTQPFFLKEVSEVFSGEVVVAEDGMEFVL